MTDFVDFEFERKFLVARDSAFPIENGSYIFQGFPYIGHESNIRVRMEATFSSVSLSIAGDGLDLLRSQDIVKLLTSVDCNETGLLTIKESGGGRSGVRYEKEVDIATDVARSILIEMALNDPSSVILKKRYSHITSYNDRTWSWEIDVFEGANAPLILAECEDAEPVSNLWIPKFCQREVTGDIRFTNAYLAAHPFSTWPNHDSYFPLFRFSDEFGTNTFESTDSS